MRTGVAILISDKREFKSKTITSDKEGHYIMIKKSVHQEDITVVNIHMPNIGAPKYIKQILTHLKGRMDNNTVIVKDLNTSLSTMNRSFMGFPGGTVVKNPPANAGDTGSIPNPGRSHMPQSN